MDNAIRAIAGSFVLISLALGAWVHPAWYWFTAFVGANLLQSAFTHWCLMEKILARLGLGTAPAESGIWAATIGRWTASLVIGIAVLAAKRNRPGRDFPRSPDRRPRARRNRP